MEFYKERIFVPFKGVWENMRILFVCTGNTCRSPMAEGIFKKIIAEKKMKNIVCESAGIAAAEGFPASPNAVQVCKEIGVDISQHRAQRLLGEKLKNYDIFAVMTQEHAHLLKAAGVPKEKIRVLGNQIPDPFGGGIAIYRECREKLFVALVELASEIELKTGGQNA